MIPNASLANLSSEELEILDRINEKLNLQAQQQQQLASSNSAVSTPNNQQTQTSTQSSQQSTQNLQQIIQQSQPTFQSPQNMTPTQSQLMLMQQQQQQQQQLQGIQIQPINGTVGKLGGKDRINQITFKSSNGSNSISLNDINLANAANSYGNFGAISASGSINGRKNTITLPPYSPSFNRELARSSKKEDFQLYYQKCLRGISHSINIIKAVLMRLVFSAHALVAIFSVYFVKKDEWYLVNFLGVVFLLIELFVTIIKRKGKEPRWFFPSFFIYICTMIPPIWLIELTRIEQSNLSRRNNQTHTGNTVLDISGLPIPNSNILDDELMDKLKIDNIAVGFEISLLILVILGRWFLPKGNISRSTLSQLLLVYMSLASDIVDLLSLLNEVQVQESSVMSYFTLAIFSWSLFQFSLNLVVTRGRSFQSVAIDGSSQDEDEIFGEDDLVSNGTDGARTFSEELNRISSARTRISSANKKEKTFCFATRFLRLDLLDSEIWSILITLIFQDGPFLALRLTAVFRFNVRTFVTMFFTCKNAIILFLQFYRLSAICAEANNNQNDALISNKADAMASLSAATTQLDRFVLLSHAQSLMLKSRSKAKQSFVDESERNLLKVSPILLRSSLTKNYSYAIVLTQNTNLSATCCQCDCHPKESTS